MRQTTMILVLGAAIAAFGAGCDDGGDTAAGGGGQGGSGAAGGSGGSGGAGGAGPIAVKVAFEGRVGAEKFDCTKTFTGLGTGASEVKLTDFRFYVHDVQLRAKDGTMVPVALDQDGVWQHEGLALVDFETGTGVCANGTAETHPEITGTVPAGEYDGVSFKLGVPFEMNHQDAAVAPSPLNLTAMFWSWNGGYKFLRVDGVVTGAPMAFNLHLGSTECQDDGNGGVASCGKPNRPTVELTGFDPTQTVILADYAAVVSGSSLGENADAPGCMSGAADPECGPIFERLGLDLETGQPKAGQTFFRTE